MTLPAFKLLILVVACATLVACGGESPEKLLTSAKDYLQKNDPKAAVIQLKNALQAQPDSAEARFLLGKALLDSGDAASASIELRKALDLKYPPETVVPVLAKAMLQEGQGVKLVEQYALLELLDAAAQAGLKTALAHAYTALKQPEKAEAALQTALKLVPNYAPARVFKARMAAANRDFDGALAQAESVIADTPNDPDPWLLKADLLTSAKGDPAAGLEAYKKALAIKPDSLAALSGMVAVHMSRGDFDAAQAALAELKKVNIAHPQTQYLMAQLAFQKRDYAAAREIIARLQKYSPDNIPVLQLASAIELYGGGSLIQAEAQLLRVLQMAPDLSLPRRMLVQTHLRNGQSTKALATLEPLLTEANPDAQVLAFAGEAHLLAGDIDQADKYFSRVAKLRPDDVRSRTVLALNQFTKGSPELAFGELQALAESDKEGISANLALISALMRGNELKRALKAIDALEAKQPDKPLAANLRGRVYTAQKDLPAARRSFEKALAIDALYFPAASALASMDLADKKPGDAKKRFEAMLERDPKHVQALLALAGLKASSGASPEEVTAALKKVVETNPTQPAPYLVLIEHLLGLKEFKLAAAAAQNAQAKLPENIEILDALGRALLASGELNQAGSAFKKLAGLQPDSAMPHVRMAEVQVAEKNSEGATQSLKRALAIQPDLLVAQNALIRLDTGAGRVKDALVTAKAVQKQRPNDASGYLLEGDIEARRKAWEPAANAYREGLKKAPSTELAVKLHSALRGNAKAAEADKFAATWLKERPSDAAFEFYLGDVAVIGKNYAAAQSRYQRVIELQEDNAAALNNLAWVTSKLGGQGALAYAEKANTLRPNQAAFLDTLAMILLEQKQFPKALETQKKALTLRAEDPSLRLNLAKIYAASGDKAAAKNELESLRKLGPGFPAQEEVSELLSKL
jgi:cellulose synthase operon protein C